MKPSTIKLFPNQPPIKDIHVMNLLKRGLITKFTNSAGEPHHKRPGWVIGYPKLNAAIASGEISQTDARRLLVIEIAATNGKPRQSHIDRLIVASFAGDRRKLVEKIKSYTS